MPSRIAVAVNVYREPFKQIQVCLTKIARHLPDAPVTVLLNERRTDIFDLCRRLGFRVISGENLGTNATWHLFWTRMLHCFVESGADVCFKLDPDTMVDGPLTSVPTDSYFGSVFNERPNTSWPPFTAAACPFVQGGITGLSIQAVRSLLAERVLEPGKDRPWMEPIPMPSPFVDDKRIAHALKSIGIEAAPWPDCLSRWLEPVLNQPVKYAIVHPRYYGMGNREVPKEFVGTWDGVIQINGRPSTMVMEITNSEGEAQAVLKRYVSEECGVLVDSIRHERTGLDLEVKTYGASSQTHIYADATRLDGSWTNSQGCGSFNLRRL